MLGGTTKIVNFMSPGAEVLALGRGHISHTVKMYYYFKNIFLFSRALIRPTKYIVLMTMQGSVYQNYEFHDLWGRGSDARAWPYKSL